MVLKLLFQFFISSCCSIAFSVYFNAPKRALITSGISAGCGWLVYYIVLLNCKSYAAAVFLGTLLIGIISELLARIQKMPVSTFIIPCIVPLVPGGGMYYTMLYAIQNNTKLMFSYFYQTLTFAGSIAVAIMVSSSIFKVVKSFKSNNRVEK
jgi:uncharacterized membrane protein YjjB (DUF3815 family)